MSNKPTPCNHRWIKQSRTLLIAVAYLVLSGVFAEANWFIDAEKFHVSAHGQLSCQDCHSDITGRPQHPDPSDVNKRLSDYFDPEQCVQCHDNVPEDLESSRHGAQEISSPEAYEKCIDCHNPHLTPSSEYGANNFDPEKPPGQQCGACHERQTNLPAFASDDEACMTCHRLIGSDEPGAVKKIGQRCLYCHADAGTNAQAITARSVALLVPEDYPQTAHSEVACTDCHLEAAAFEHGSQPPVDCRQCHLPHAESKAHDAHLTVACQACHLSSVEPLKDARSGQIRYKKERNLDESLNIHEMTIPEDEASCRRCHTSGNPVGASAMVLPAKSVICMICHTATFSVGDTITVVALIGLTIGLGMSLLLIFSASSGKSDASGTKAAALGAEASGGANTRWVNTAGVVKEIILNLFFQKRLFQHSPWRWFIHGLLFFPMALRFLWGIVTLCASLWQPQFQWVWRMIDKNNGATAFFFDLTGMMIFTGVILALVRHQIGRAHRVAGLPSRSRMALVLLGGIVLVGFVLEGMRIAMTGVSGSAAYAFIGFAISKLFSNPEMISGVYGYVWYAHAALTGAFIVMLPFSRMLHMIIAPVVLALNASTSHDLGGRHR